MSVPLLSIKNLEVSYPISGDLFQATRYLRAVRSVSFDLAPGETLGIVGESGCGKSSLGRAALRLIKPTAGSIDWDGEDLTRASAARLRQLRREMTVVFQDPLASLNPRMNVGALVREPLDIFEPQLSRAEKRRRVGEALERVQMSPAIANRYPHQFSGGQCQRIGIARAIILKPKMILCDEAVSALDVSVQAEIVGLLRALGREDGVALLFISHNLAVVRQISHRVMVLYLGETMEIADRESLYRRPRHPYTNALLAAVPVPDPVVERQRKRVPLRGEIPSPLSPPSGCVFHTRCPHKIEICVAQSPVMEAVTASHFVACHRWRENLDKVSVPTIDEPG